MSSELQRFQQDLLESVKQMRQGQAARVTKVKLPAAAEARAQVGLSQFDFTDKSSNHMRPSIAPWKRPRSA